MPAVRSAVTKKSVTSSRRMFGGKTKKHSIGGLSGLSGLRGRTPESSGSRKVHSKYGGKRHNKSYKKK